MDPYKRFVSFRDLEEKESAQENPLRDMIVLTINPCIKHFKEVSLNII